MKILNGSGHCKWVASLNHVTGSRWEGKRRAMTLSQETCRHIHEHPFQEKVTHVRFYNQSYIYIYGYPYLFLEVWVFLLRKGGGNVTSKGEGYPKIIFKTGGSVQMKRNQKWLSGLFAFFLLFSTFVMPMSAFAEPSTDTEEEGANVEDNEEVNHQAEENNNDDQQNEDKNEFDDDGKTDDNGNANDHDKEKTNDDNQATNEENIPENTETEEMNETENESEDESEVSEKKERAPPATVDVRVETHDKTLVPPTEVTVESFELKAYIDNDNGGDSVYPDTPRAIHAIIQALEHETDLDLKDDNVFSLGYGGNYIHEIDGDGEFTGGQNSGWMYYVDNEYVGEGVLERELDGGESIVLYYVTDYMDNTFTWFDEEAYTVEAGDPLELELTGVNFDAVNPVEGASILIDEEVYADDGEEVLTAADGKVDVVFDAPGIYHLSANRVNDNGDRNIVRPYATVEVSEKADTTPPVITVEGINDGEEMAEKETTFTVKAVDDVDGEMTPTVKVNDEEIEQVDGGYQVELREGDNRIEVTAEDKAGNVAAETYDITFEPESDLSEPEDDKEEYNIKDRIDKTASYILSNKVKTEWQAIGLARAGKDVPSSYYDDAFYQNIETQVDEAMEWNRAKITDIERLAIAAVAIDKDPTDINGTNLIEYLYDSPMRGETDSMLIQGNNGPIFALIALDSLDFPEPEESKWNREKLIQELIQNQNDDGSWSLNPSYPNPSIDVTAMAIIGLSPYKDQPDVNEAIEGAIEYLSSVQNDKGGFTESFVGGTSSEATSQTIIGLTAYGMDPTDEMFTKNGNNLIDHLLTYQNADGGFSHLLDYGSNGMATEQAMQALVAYDLFVNDGGRLYDFSGMEDPVVDKEYLEEKIQEAENVDTDHKTDESVHVLEEAIQQAKFVLSDEKATEDDVSEAIRALTDAIDGLENNPTPEVDKSKLEEAIEAASDVDLTNMTPESADAFEAALSAANSAMATEDATQSDIDSAAENLKESMDSLAEKANKDELISKVEEAESMDVEGKTANSVEALEKSIKNAQSVLEDDNVSQAEVDDALMSLQEAMDHLEVKVDKDALVSKIEEAESLDLDDKTAHSVEGLEQAIKDAKAVMAADDATQSDVDEAVQSIREAIDRLETGDEAGNEPGDESDDEVGDESGDDPVDKDDLGELIDEAEDHDTSGKTQESIKSLNEAINDAKSVLNDDDATEEDVAKALKRVKGALDTLMDESDSGQDEDSVDDDDDQESDGVPGLSGSGGGNSIDAATVEKESEDTNRTLPATATANFTFMLFGGVLLMAAMILIVIQRRKSAE